MTCDRDEFRKKLNEEYGIGTGVHYIAVWNWEAAAHFEYDKSDCPVTEKMCASVVTLPVFPNTSDEELEYIAWAIQELVNKVKK